MTGNTDDDDSSERLITTRGVLKGIGGIGIGAALGVGGIYAVADQTDYVDMDAIRGPEPPEKKPPATEPETDPEVTKAPHTTPWDKQHLVVSIVRADNIVGNDYILQRLDNAVEFWNDYIEANEQFDLTLSFEATHSDPDIQFQETSIMQCFGEYDSPATNDEYLAPLVCVETLRETPSETPVTATIGGAVAGKALYELIAKHAIGRLIGFDIWSDPVDVMTPTILFGPAHADQPDAQALLRRPGRAVPDLESVSDDAERSIESLQTSDGLIVETLEHRESEFADFVSRFENEMNQYTTEAERFDFPLYVEAYEAAIVNDELAYINETRTMMTDLAEKHTNEELQESDKLEPVIERLNHISTWASEREMWDVQIHRHYGDAVWSAWISK